MATLFSPCNVVYIITIIIIIIIIIRILVP